MISRRFFASSFGADRFVPTTNGIDGKAFDKFQEHFSRIDKLVVMTGAGISTESGIPDYRSKLSGRYREHRPITYQEFMGSEWWRRRYWARNFLAWPRFSAAQCNVTHRTMARWEHNDPNRFLWLITQNVDGLHAKAGSQRLSELHGCGHAVRCMKCGDKYAREQMQCWLNELNASWDGNALAEQLELRPDGDVDVPEQYLHSFAVPHCPRCGPGSVLKTDVVFFGDTVPAESVKHCSAMINECSGLLVLGSSLTVMSGFRFAVQAQMLDLPILIVNIGATRADPFATAKLDARCSEVVARLGWSH
ncbi:hypothetical protein niasHS_015395 [Heterodera schachtii]|uniref:Deacetylase sirtuin-type domain-containing protein n=1 Tax=Heterodera schachtii TaxID=97005 RepID=A0ABD2HYH5_HETSC